MESNVIEAIAIILLAIWNYYQHRKITKIENGKGKLDSVKPSNPDST